MQFRVFYYLLQHEKNILNSNASLIGTTVPLFIAKGNVMAVV